MPLPPRNDPRRPLALAISSTRLLGIVFMLFGVVIVLWFRFLLGNGSRVPILLVLQACFWFVPGVLYIIFAIFLSKRAAWAVIATMVIAGFQSLLMLLALLGAPIHGSWGLTAFQALWTAALAQLIYQLSKSFESIRACQETRRGFEVQPIVQITQMEQGSDASGADVI
ncbi:MAG TPA: hypothetical protein VFC78_15895 [Tepidisphaeraceae bacterium]|nr:hypothetical protein [Tepidisphaeraceae bacterium]